jgi:hypothetical protein
MERERRVRKRPVLIQSLSDSFASNNSKKKAEKTQQWSHCVQYYEAIVIIQSQSENEDFKMLCTKDV